MVCVRPGKLPAKVMVAPNSPSARAQHSTAPAPIPGAISGRVTRRNVVQREAPRVAAASSYLRSAARSAPSTLITRNGRATNASATTTPAVVNGSVTPNQRYIHWPSSPLRPRASSSATPPTTGGSTRGTVTSARTRRRPGKDARASTHASGTPTSRQNSVARVAQTRDSRSAWRISGRPSRVPIVDQGARNSRPATGSTRKANPMIAGSTSTQGARRFTTVRADSGPSFGPLHDDVGGLDDGHGDHAGLQPEVVGGLAAHQRDEAVRPRLDLHLRHHTVTYDVGDDAAHPVARGGQRRVGLGGRADEGRQVGPGDDPVAVLVAFGGQPPGVDPPPDGVGADVEQGGDLADSEHRHGGEYISRRSGASCMKRQGDAAIAAVHRWQMRWLRRRGRRRGGRRR